MYTFLRIRAQQTVLDVISALEDMSLTEIAGNRGFPSDRYSYVSTASTPSMRAREADMADSRPSTPNEGNSVKVVVRVRKFLQRGKSSTSILYLVLC